MDVERKRHGVLSRYITSGKFKVVGEPNADELRKKFKRYYPHLKEWCTTSGSPQEVQPQDNVGGQVAGTVQQSPTPPSSTLARERKGHMPDQDELGSIVEYSEDISEAEAPEPLPSAEYEATIKAAVQRIGTTSGKKYAAVTFHISVDEFPADYPVEDNPDGVSVTYRLVSLEDNPRARFQCRRFCEAIGAKAGKRIDLNEWVGLSAMVGIIKDTFEGVPREAINKVSAIA